MSLDGLQSRDELLLRQRITVMVNRYEVYVPAAPGTGSKQEGELLVFAEQRRMKLKEEIGFFADTAKTRPLFSVKAENVLDPRGRYQLLDPSGAVIARFKKSFGQSFLRSTWHLQDAAGNQTGVARERNLIAALFRRYGSLVPYVGELLGLVPIAYNFDFTDASGDLLAVNEKLWSIRDRFRLTVTPAGKEVDRRLLVAMAVCQDALQRR
ncbi:MAG: hypothetical protein ACRDKJ_01370 [Actinomycetota bacterium]